MITIKLFPFRYSNSLVAGTHKVQINFPVPGNLKRLYIEVDNTVTIWDNFNIIAGGNGSPNSLSLESIFDVPVNQVLGISPLEITVVTTVTTKITVYAEIEV